MALPPVTVALTVTLAVSAALLVGGPVAAAPAVDLSSADAFTMENIAPRSAAGTSDALADEPDMTLLPERQPIGEAELLALDGEPGELLFRVSFVEDADHQGRLELERLNAELRLDRWDHASVRPVDLTGWLTGRENAWGKSEHTGSEKLADMLNDIGCTLPVGITVGLLASESPSRQRAGRSARDAVLATSAATHLLKAVVNSPRPVNPDNYEGFPSGHTSLTVAFARAISEDHRDWGALAYLWAGGVAWSRVHRGDHTTEQVIAGALLGWFIADSMASGRAQSEFTVPREAGAMVPAGGVRW